MNKSSKFIIFIAFIITGLICAIIGFNSGIIIGFNKGINSCPVNDFGEGFKTAESFYMQFLPSNPKNIVCK